MGARNPGVKPESAFITASAFVQFALYCKRHIPKAGAALITLLILGSAITYARDAHSVGEWLSGKLFSRPGIWLALDRDGFFALRMEQKGKPVQNVTGLWRLAADGIELTLYNSQDAEIKLSVGRDGLHGLLGDTGQILLAPDSEKGRHFRVTGVLTSQNGSQALIDAASGRSFKVETQPKAELDKFAIADLEFDGGFSRPGKLIKHSGPVPRSYARPGPAQSPDIFAKKAAGKFWLLPPALAPTRAGLRFSEPALDRKGALGGSFEVAGAGLRLDGNYSLDKDKLTLQAARASLRNLEIIGFGELARRLPGQFTWRTSSRGLELVNEKGALLFLAQ